MSFWDKISAPIMAGATALAAGRKGLVPRPAAGDQAKYLRADGTWASPAGAGDLVSTNNLSDLNDRYTARRNLKLIEPGSIMGANWLESDGATSNRRIETQYGTLGAVAGSDLTEVDHVLDVPTSNPSADAFVFMWSTSTSAVSANALVCYCASNGTLFVEQYGATTGDVRRLAYVGWRAAFSGRRVRLTIAFTGNSTTTPTVWQDGVDITASFTGSTAGAPANWVPTTLATTYYLIGRNWTAGVFRPGRPVNRKYAQSDVDFLTIAGRIPFVDMQGGAMGLTPSAATNFQYDTFTGASTSGYTAEETGGQSCEATFSSGGTFLGVRPIGTRYRVRFTATLTSGAVPSVKLMKAGTGNASALAVVINGANDHVLTLTAELTAESGTGAGQIGFITSGNTSYAISGLTVVREGALSEPLITRALMLSDNTPNEKPATLVGFSPVTARPQEQRRVNLQTGTSYTLLITDYDATVSMNNAAANTLTVPAHSSVSFPLGTAIPIRQKGAGQTSIAAAGGVTINSRGAALKLAGQHAYATLVKVGNDEWDLTGDITT